MWVVDIIENCITLWNSTLSSIWSMLTQSPETFHNGAVWDAITKIFTALQGAGYGLLVLFFAMSFFKHTVSSPGADHWLSDSFCRCKGTDFTGHGSDKTDI